MPATFADGDLEGFTIEERLAALADHPPGSEDFRRCRDEIVRRCLTLADNIARRFAGRGESVEDLVQVARIGLVNAVDRYDVASGSKFVAFAVPTIMGEVRRHFRDNGWSVKVPRGLKDLHVMLGAATCELSQRLGRAPNASELAVELKMSREEVVQGLIAGSARGALSLDVPVGGREGAISFAETWGDVDVDLARIEDREVLRRLLAALPERERTVLILRFFESLTQTQIAERIGVSQMQVSRLLAASLARLRDRMP